MTRLAANDSDAIAWTGSIAGHRSWYAGCGPADESRRVEPVDAYPDLHFSGVSRAAELPPGASAGKPEALVARITP